MAKRKTTKKKNPGGAPMGNTNAEKYPREKVIELLESMIQMAQINHGTDEKPEYIHLKIELLFKHGIYSKQWLGDMRKKFKGDKVVSELICGIDAICEINSYKDGASGIANAQMVKMNLATHYGWTTEKSQSQQTHQVSMKSVEDLQKELEDLENDSSTWDE